MDGTFLVIGNSDYYENLFSTDVVPRHDGSFVVAWSDCADGDSDFFGGMFVLGRLSPKFGSWYSSRRLRALGVAT